MSDIGKLCRKASGALAYKGESSAKSLIYKSQAGDWTMVSFAWDENGEDLDIMAKWSDGGNTVGFDYNANSGDYSTGGYGLKYSGDIKGTANSEWVKIKRSPWSTSSKRFEIRLNFYGYNSSSKPTSKCTVIAAQLGAETLIKNDVPCGTSSKSPATSSSPGVAILFDNEGFLSSIVLI